jgi:N-acetylmuramidase
MALSEDDFEQAATRLGCEVAAIKSVAEVECGQYGAFLPTGEPVILFERHKFSKLTGGKYDKTHPDISNPKPGGYGKVSAQHARLEKAAELDREAALQSCSWGLFQVLGMNWESLGYPSLQDFVNRMYRSEADHLDSFLRYVERNNLARHLKSRNWAAFALGYNGKTYKQNKYDTKLADAYKKHGGANDA